MLSRRKHDKSVHGYVDPSVQLNAGLWTLFAGASLFLGLRIWIKLTRRHGLWYDDHILLVTWVSTLILCETSRTRRHLQTWGLHHDL